MTLDPLLGRQSDQTICSHDSRGSSGTRRSNRRDGFNSRHAIDSLFLLALARRFLARAIALVYACFTTTTTATTSATTTGAAALASTPPHPRGETRAIGRVVVVVFVAVPVVPRAHRVLQRVPEAVDAGRRRRRRRHRLVHCAEFRWRAAVVARVQVPRLGQQVAGGGAGSPRRARR